MGEKIRKKGKRGSASYLKGKGRKKRTPKEEYRIVFMGRRFPCCWQERGERKGRDVLLSISL